MVLESLAATLLSKYLGDYLSGLQKENLKLSILSGQVTLENVELKREAVDALDLPVVVKEGFVGTVSLTVPWRNLGTQPAIIKLDRVFLLVVPKDPNQQEDESRYEKRLQDEKQKQLRNWESMKQARLEMEAAAKDKSGDTFTMKLVTKVVDNLQLEITNVHIRIEDNITDPEKPFVAGITIEKVSGQSTDHSWNPKWLENETIVHKLLSLKNLALYWNPSEPFLKFKTSSEAAEALQKLIMTGTQSPKHHYVLQPVSGELRVTMNKSDAPDMKNPKVTADLMLPELGVTLEELQYNNLANLLDIWSLYQRGIKYRKLRPKTPLKNSPRMWWKFAANCIIEEIRHKQQQWTWDYMSVRTKSRKDYINLYRKVNVGVKMTPAETERLQELEKNLTYDDITFFRSIADAMMRRDQSYVEEQRKKKSSTTNAGWTSYFWTAKPAEITSQDIEKLPDTKMTNDEWEELYQMIGYNKSDTYVAPSQQPKEYVSVRAAFSLKKAVVRLVGAESPIAFATASDLSLAAMIRPTSTIFQASLGDVEVTDQHTKDTKFPKLLYRSPTSEVRKGEDNRLIVASYEMGPLDKPDDYYATLEIKPLEVIYQKHFIDRILAFIRNATPEAVENIEITIANKLRGLRETTQLQLLQALEAQKTFGASINIRAPTILFPEDWLDQSTSLFVVDLGRFQMESVHKKKQEEQKEFYEDYKIVLAQLKAFLAKNNDDWRSTEVQRLNKDKMSLIEGFDINLHLKQAKVDSEALTRVIVEGALPALELNVSPEKLGKILSIVYSSLGMTGSAPASAPTQPSPSLPSDQTAAPTIDLSKTDLSKKEADRNLLARLKLFEGNFAINRVTLALTNESRDLAVITASGFNIKMLKRTYDLKADVQLASITIEDKMQTFGEDFKYIATSGEKSSKLIEIHYFSVDRISPEYKNVDQEIDFKFSTLNVNFNRDTVLTLLNVINKLTATIAGPTPAVTTTATPQITADSKQTVVARKRKDITTIKLAANLGELSLSLNRESKKIALIAVTKVTAYLNMREDATMDVQGTLGNILLKDLTELGQRKYSTVLETISASEMIEFKYATYTLEDKLGYDSSIDELLTYLNEVQQVKEVIDGVSSKAAEMAKDAVVESRQLMKMDFTITNPIILAPRNSTSSDVIEADLGKIVINNKFSYPQNELSSRNDISEVISLGITAMNLATGEFNDGQVTNKNQVLLDTSLTLQITRSLHSESSDMKIAAAIPNIGITLSEPQIQSLLSVYTENMNEKGSFTSSIVKPHLDTDSKQKAIEPASTSSKPPSTTELEFRLGKVSLETFAYDPITKTSTPMIGFFLNKFDVHLTQKSDSSMNANLGIATILISDIREKSFKHIFSQEDSKASLIRVDYSRDPQGNQFIKAHFDKPQLTVVPETVMPLKDFFMKVLGDVQKSLAAVATTPTTEVTSPSTAVAKVDPLVYTKIAVDLNEICVKLVDRTEVLSKLYARGLGFNMNQRQYDMSLEATLTSLVLEDCVQPFGEEFKYLIDTSSSQQGEFIKVEYKSAQQLSPDYDNVEQLINLKFNNLNINMNRETLVKLIDLSTRFSTSTASIEQSGELTSQQPATVDTSAKPKDLEVKDSSVTTLKLNAKIDSLGATLNKNGSKLASISITKVSTEYASRKDNTMIAKGSLGNVAIRDLTEGGIKYPDILDIVSSDSKFIEFSYETFASTHSIDSSVSILSVLIIYFIIFL